MSPESEKQPGTRINGDFNSRHTEFEDLGSLTQSSERKRRLEQESENKRRFIAYGDDLWNMREFMDELSRKLLKSINDGDREKEKEIREELYRIENQDPDLVYKIQLQKMQQARSEGREDDARHHNNIAMAARNNLPQFNLEGLWVGK